MSRMQHMAPVVLMLLALSWRISIADDCSNANGGSKFASTIVVDNSGKRNFNSIQSAINSIPPNNNQWIKLQINPGVYREQVTIPREKPCIVLEGHNSSVTTITFDGHDGTDTSTTFTSVADNIVAKVITFKAVAARILGDKSAFSGCIFLGLQETLWDALGRHYFYSCHIEGAVDFMFGSGQSFYEDCSIKVTGGAFSAQLREGYITAQGRASSNDPSGFVFKQAKIYGTLQHFLGRAYGPCSGVIFQETTMDAEVVPQGWYAWEYTGKGENFMYAEVNCEGPGTDTSRRVPWE